jgi:DNA helicase HerA-like ATPase
MSSAHPHAAMEYSPPRTAPEEGGVVLGSLDATPLEFWVGVPSGSVVQLDDLVAAETELPGGLRVRFYGVVDQVRKKYEGTFFDNDAFRVTEGTLPADVSYAAHVQVTRIDPEVFVPPSPGDRAWVVRGEEFQRALYFDRMPRRIPIGYSRTGEVVFANLEFLDGTRGAHVSISGVSGVATKTSYATFLLYALFHSGALGADATNAKALVFNVKGEDLLWLDHLNTHLSSEVRAEYGRLGLPAGPFQSVAFYAPAKRQSRTPIPDVGSRQVGVRPYLWTIREFCRDGLLRFCFAEAEDARAQLGFVVARVESHLRRAAEQGHPNDPGVTIAEQRITTFRELVELLDGPTLDGWVHAAASGTLDAFRRRLHAASDRMGHLVRGDREAVGYRIDLSGQQVTVVDIHTLHAQAQMFVVGVLLKRMMEEKERQGTARPLLFVVLDELNKYAPREGSSPIRDVLLDIAERGRSLGVSLVGCQQTASEVERRILANAAIKVVGRLDAAEAERGEYGFLTRTARLRASMLQPGTMIVSQPDIPTPILLHFPYPAWATRSSEAQASEELDPFARL